MPCTAAAYAAGIAHPACGRSATVPEVSVSDEDFALRRYGIATLAKINGARKRTVPALRMRLVEYPAGGDTARASPAVKTMWSRGFIFSGRRVEKRVARLVSRVAESERLQMWPVM